MGRRREVAKDPHPLDVCACGDYREQHAGPELEGRNGCRQFGLSVTFQELTALAEEEESHARVQPDDGIESGT